MFKNVLSGLSKTKSLFMNNLKGVFAAKPSDAKSKQEVLQELEDALLESDVGVRTTQFLVQRIKSQMESSSSSSSASAGAGAAGAGAAVEGQSFDLKQALRMEMLNMLESNQRRLDLRLQSRAKPTVLLVVGVNGTGKTTSVAKLVHFYKTTEQEQLRRSNIVVAAADLVRAAAVEQLQEWGKRVNVPVIVRDKNADGAKPDLVVYDAIQHCMQRIKESGAAASEADDLVIVDTAGRMQNNAVSMRELQMIQTAASKARKGAPDHVWLVVDSTIGQSSIDQAKAFQQRVRVNGIIVTKLDGSAKGGVVFAIANELKIPVAFVGVGEKVDDLRPFDPLTFVNSILPEEGAVSDTEEAEKAEKSELIIQV